MISNLIVIVDPTCLYTIHVSLEGPRLLCEPNMEYLSETNPTTDVAPIIGVAV